ncbi:universal stress protein [Synechococcus sp. 60AY4M2]|jgi:nucleotide-binding universal stress UspA family protein|uniref:universal stress protein n=1 Tax=unclassified Synechococcus TaxID=2626047 RepID=UPI000C19AC1A|nr:MULTISPECIES: universal stress protein [unclassified Synechococcus]PIK96560.1 universal stress protein [Synechococcus sp. 60AY4M2]PIK99219.1 universal stress protein [Synechococcus sp. 63AY4M1]PIL00639.1 universal stress protein [Synechococcus sp. 65AY640]
MFKSLLIATDCRDGLQRFGKCLEELYLNGIERVAFVHSVARQDDDIGLPEDLTPKVQAQQARLHEVLSAVPAGLEVKVLVQAGKAVDLILRGIQTCSSDLLITGMGIHNLLTEKLFGSTTLELLPKLTIPVMVMRPQLIAAFTLEELHLRSRHLFRSLLVPFDFEEPRRQLLSRLGQLLPGTSQCQAITLLYVVDPSARRNQGSPAEELKRRAEADLARLVEPLVEQVKPVQLRALVRVGSPLQEILATAAEEDMTAIATASPRVGTFWEWSIRSLTGEILRQSWHPVLFFPRGSLA